MKVPVIGEYARCRLVPATMMSKFSADDLWVPQELWVQVYAAVRGVPVYGIQNNVMLAWVMLTAQRESK